jgi:spore germination protein (amino acid permease)
MIPEIPENEKISNYFIIFLIVSGQIGTAALGFQRIVLKSTGYDAWIAIIIAGLFIHLFMYMIYSVLKNGEGDIIYIHQKLFGKWIGNILSLGLILYALFAAITVFRTYLEIIQVWMFPKLNLWFFSFVFMLLAYYAISGGFRIISGVTVLSFAVLLVICPFFLFALEFSEFQNMLPVMKHTIPEVLGGAKAMTLSYLGFEAILLYYPFIKKAKRSQRWAHAGVSITIFFYLYLGIISFAFYSEEQLSRTIWGTLSLFKIIEMPFVERFEYIGISLWAILVLANVLISVWVCSHGSKRIFKINPNIPLVITLIIIVIVSNFITSRTGVNTMNNYMANAGFYLLVAYVPFIFIVQKIKNTMKGSEGK